MRYYLITHGNRYFEGFAGGVPFFNSDIQKARRFWNQNEARVYLNKIRAFTGHSDIDMAIYPAGAVLA